MLIYKDGEVREQIVTLQGLGGEKCGVEDVEKVLVALGAVKLGDLRLRKKEEGGGAERREDEGRSIRQTERKTVVDDEDSDWE